MEESAEEEVISLDRHTAEAAYASTEEGNEEESLLQSKEDRQNDM